MNEKQWLAAVLAVVLAVTAVAIYGKREWTVGLIPKAVAPS